MSLKSFMLRSITGLGVVALIATALTSFRYQPARAQDPASHGQKIESDDPAILQEGAWVSQPAPAASGGSYLYNTGKATLELQFVGPSLEVLYVAGPSLGTLAIEVDGVVLRTVITTDAEVRYQQSAQIDYLTDETHKLKVYAQAGGVIGVDAFMIGQSYLPAINQNLSESSLANDPRYPCPDTSAVSRLSVNAGGIEANGRVLETEMSADGRYIVFLSEATNLLEGTPSGPQMYYLDRQTCHLQYGAVLSNGQVATNPSNAHLSSTGEDITFTATGTNGYRQVYLRIIPQGLTLLDSNGYPSGEGNQSSMGLDITGWLTLFISTATNIEIDDHTSDMDAFVHHRGHPFTFTYLMSTGTGGVEIGMTPSAGSMSDNAYIITLESSDAPGYGGDTNGFQDVFLVIRSGGLASITTTRITMGLNGEQPNGNSRWPEISGDGQHIAFTSDASNLVPNDTNGAWDIFVYHRATGQIERISVGPGGIEGNASSMMPKISRDGRFIAFSSDASNLVADDTNNAADVFLYDAQTQQIERISSTVNGEALAGAASVGDVSDDGRYVSFISDAANIVPNDTNGVADLFIRDRQQPFSNIRLQATAVSGSQVELQWSFITPPTGDVELERSFMDATHWQPLATLPIGQTTYSDPNLRCGNRIFYRLRDVTPVPPYQEYSNVAWSRTAPCENPTLALFRPEYNWVSLINTLQFYPPLTAYQSYGANPPDVGQYTMGDWDGDGDDTSSVYAASGAFWYTNEIGPNTTWDSIWLGVSARQVVAGRFHPAYLNDCFGAVTGGTAGAPWNMTSYVLFYICDFSSGPTPTVFNHWALYQPVPGTGDYQFAVGDFDGDSIDTITVRRSNVIVWSNVRMFNQGRAVFNFAQGIYTYETGDYGTLVAGDWDEDYLSSFGIVYQSGNFSYRNDLLSAQLSATRQLFGQPFGTPFTATTWR